MCYFINLKITPQRLPEPANELVERLAKRAQIHLRGEFPLLQLTNGQCSCSFFLNGDRAITVAPLVEELVKADCVKRVEVGLTWAKGADVTLKPDAEVQRLSVQEFVALNGIGGLQSEVWYRLNDPDKYVFPDTGKKLRPFGLAAGQFTVPDDFDTMCAEEIRREFEGD